MKKVNFNLPHPVNLVPHEYMMAEEGSGGVGE